MDTTTHQWELVNPVSFSEGPGGEENVLFKRRNKNHIILFYLDKDTALYAYSVQVYLM